MDKQLAANSSRSVLVRLWPWLAVLLVLLFIGFVRLRLLGMPLERDEGEYAYAGQLILQGIPPYELAYNMKLPGTYYAYALGMAVFGQTCAGVHLTLLAANALTILCLFFLAKRLFGVAAGLAASSSYALMSVSTSVYGLAAHATQFVVLFAVPGVWALWQALMTNQRRTFFCSGLLFGLAFLMIQPGLCFGWFGLAAIFARAVQKRVLLKRNFLLPLSSFGAGLVLPFVLCCLTVWVAGDFARFWFWTFDYAGRYTEANTFAKGVKNLGESLQSQLPVIGYWILAGFGLMIALRCRLKRLETIFVSGLLFFSLLGVMPGFYFREHYFVLLLPAFSLLIGAAIQLSLLSASRGLRVMPLFLLAGALGWHIWLERQVYFQRNAAQVCRLIYRDNPFAESLVVGNYLRDHSPPDARIAVIGSEPEIYFYARRHSVTGYIYTYALMEKQPYATRMQHEMAEEIEAGKPEYVVVVLYKFSWLLSSFSDNSILHWTDNFTRQYYNIVGVIGQQPGGESIWLTGADAENFHGPLDQFMVICQRRPGSR